MDRDFIAYVLDRALREEDFVRLLQKDASAAALATRRTYGPDELRVLEAIRGSIVDLDVHAARHYLIGISQQPENIFGGPMRSIE